MGKEIDFNIFSKKDARITIASMVIVFIIFLSQLFLFYRLYQSNIDLLQRELNLAVNEIYKEDLNRRLKKKSSKPSLEYYGSTKPDAVTDTTKVTVINSKGAIDSKGAVMTMNAAIEEYVSKHRPIDLQVLDSIAADNLSRRGITNPFYSEIIDRDKERDSILHTSKTSDINPWQTLSSAPIPLNAAQTKTLVITLVNPLSSFYVQMGAMFFLSSLLCLICLYSFYVHQRTLARQKEVSKLKNELFADISHEFKRPLHSLKMVMSSLEQLDVAAKPEKKIRLVRIGNREVDKMDDQREMILTMSKDDEGFLELNYTDFDIREVIAESVKRFEDTVEKPEELDIEIKNDISGSSFVKADKEHISLVVSNLIENAIKYSKAPAKININLFRDNNSLCFSVSDNGIGISEENLSLIFDRFSRIPNTETKAKGYGIGLNYVKRIIEKHKGTVSVVSNRGEGSRFTISIPADTKR